MLPKVCLIATSPELQNKIKLELQDWFYISSASTGAQALQMIETEKFDALLLDTHLPDGSGLEICSRIKSDRQRRDIAVIFISAQTAPYDKQIAFSIGADDYLPKPPEPIELRARLQARVRDKRQGAPLSSLRVGKLRFDSTRQRLYGTFDGGGEEDINLTPFEFRLLYFMANHAERIFNRKELLQHLMDRDIQISEDTVYTHISSIRRKLGSLSTHLENLPRIGYRFTSKN